METLDDILENEAKSISEKNERDLHDDDFEYKFIASINIFSAPFVIYEKKLEKCRTIERQLDMMPYISRHSDVIVYLPEVPDKKPGWISEWNHKIVSTSILPSGLYVRFVFGFNGSFKTSNERKHLLWWLRHYCCSDNLCTIDLINHFNTKKSFSYNDCGDIGLAMKYPGSAEIKRKITSTNFEKIYQRLKQLDKEIDEFFEPSVTTYDFVKYNGLYMMNFDSVCVLDPKKTYLLTPTI